MKWPWPPPTLKDALAIGLVAAFLMVILFASVLYPPANKPAGNEGFGPDWNCKSTGSGEPVCVKKAGSGQSG